MLIAQKYFEYKKWDENSRPFLILLLAVTMEPIPQAFIYVYVQFFPLSLFLFLQFWCSVKRGYFQSIYNEIRKQWMESLGIKTWWRQDFPPFTFSPSLWRKRERGAGSLADCVPSPRPSVRAVCSHSQRREHVEGASAQQPLGRQHVWKLPALKTKHVGGIRCELFAQAGLAGCLASCRSTQPCCVNPCCVNPPHIPAVLTLAVLTHPGCSQGTWSGEQYRTVTSFPSGVLNLSFCCSTLDMIIRDSR